MSNYLLDSDVIIWYLRGREEVVSLLQNLAHEKLLGCSPLSVIEIKLGMKKNEEDSTNCLFDAITVWDINREIAEQAVKYIIYYKGKGVTLDFVDATIAATCKLRDLTLMTYNTDHFPMNEVRKHKMPLIN